MTRTANKDNYCFQAVIQSTALITWLLDQSHICSHNLGKTTLHSTAAYSADIASSQFQTQWVTFPSRKGKPRLVIYPAKLQKLFEMLDSSCRLLSFKLLASHAASSNYRNSARILMATIKRGFRKRYP